MKNLIDVAAWVGSYPFRNIPNSNLKDLRIIADELEINRIIVSSFENLFWQNGLDAYEIWQTKLKDYKFIEHWPVVNPTVPGELEVLQDLTVRNKFQGFRLLPNYHSYNLEDSCIKTFMEFASQNRKIVQVFQQIADERWHWMLKVPKVDAVELSSFIQDYPDNTIILSALDINENILNLLHDHPNTYIDISRFTGPCFVLERVISKLPDQFLFASLWPLQILQASLWQIEYADISQENKEHIMSKNYIHMLDSFSRETKGNMSIISKKRGSRSKEPT